MILTSLENIFTTLPIIFQKLCKVLFQSYKDNENVVQTSLYLKNTLREIQEKSNGFKQNNSYIRTKILHNLETVYKTLGELEQIFDKKTHLFSEQESIFARNKIYNSEALDRLEKDVKEAGEFMIKIKASVTDFKTHKKKIDDTSKLGWDEIGTFTRREEEVESQQVDNYIFIYTS